MTRVNTIILMVVMLAVLCASSCKKSEEADPQFVLTVQCAEGVEGSPASGSWAHAQGTEVPYQYSAAAGHKNLAVSLDGQAASPSGVIVMNQNHALRADIEKILYMQGNWSCDLVWSSGDCNVGPAYGIPVSGSQNGGNCSLSFQDIPLGNNQTMDLTLNGTIDEAGNFTMSGTQTVVYGGATTLFEFNGSGKMSSETRFSADVNLKITVNNVGQCTKKGILSGKKN